MKFKKVSFKQFGKDFKEYYNLKDVRIRNYAEAEDVMLDLYDTDLFKFNYDKKVLEIYYK